MAKPTLTDEASHPPIRAWVWGEQGVAYQVTRRFERGGFYWLTLATGSGLVDMPLDRVVGWALSPPIENEPQKLKTGQFVKYSGRGRLSSMLRPLLRKKTLVVKSIQCTPKEGTWVTVSVPGKLDQTVPIDELLVTIRTPTIR